MVTSVLGKSRTRASTQGSVIHLQCGGGVNSLKGGSIVFNRLLSSKKIDCIIVNVVVAKLGCHRCN